MTYRVTFLNKEGVEYTYPLKDDNLNLHQGEWMAPFPNTSYENLAFRLLQSLKESKIYPPMLFESEITYCRIYKSK